DVLARFQDGPGLQAELRPAPPDALDRAGAPVQAVGHGDVLGGDVVGPALLGQPVVALGGVVDRGRLRHPPGPSLPARGRGFRPPRGRFVYRRYLRAHVFVGEDFTGGGLVGWWWGRQIVGRCWFLNGG